jgi:hypothetical protein
MGLLRRKYESHEGSICRARSGQYAVEDEKCNEATKVWRLDVNLLLPLQKGVSPNIDRGCVEAVI